MTDNTIERMEEVKRRCVALFGNKLEEAGDVINEFAFTFANMNTEAQLVGNTYEEDWKTMAKGMMYLAKQLKNLEKLPAETKPAIKKRERKTA